MKKNGLLITTVFLFAIFFSSTSLIAQDNSETLKQKELKLKQAMDLQKKAMNDQKRSIDLQIELANIKMDTLRRSGQEGFDQGNFRSHVRSSGGNSFEIFDDPVVVSPRQGSGYSFYYGRGGDSERTTWDYSKQVKESTYTKDLSFDVEKTAKSVSMSLIGDCKTGQIRVKIIMPNGKLYSDIVIDESGNLNWRKSFSITEELNKDKTGEWKFKIGAEKASGYFKISLQTN
jgi:hypothetical protein